MNGKTRPPSADGASIRIGSLRGSAQKPDTFFQAREACSPFYEACPTRCSGDDEVRRADGRHYKLFDYIGHPEAERVVG